MTAQGPADIREDIAEGGIRTFPNAWPGFTGELMLAEP